jgi:hypothetical protein
VSALLEVPGVLQKHVLVFHIRNPTLLKEDVLIEFATPSSIVSEGTRFI